MKLFKLFLVACILCTGHVVWSQEPGYAWGEPSTNDNIDREIDHLLSYGDEGFVLLRSKYETAGVVNYWIESYDTDLKLKEVNRVEFSQGFMGDSYDIEEIIASHGKVYAFVSHWNKEEGQNSLSVKELNLDGTMTDMAELDVIQAEKMMNRGMYDFTFSDDGSKLLVTAEKPFVKKAMEKIRFSCFEVSTMAKLWSTDEELQWPSERAPKNEVAVDNKGRAYFFKSIRQKSIWSYELQTVDATGKMMIHDVLNLSEKEIVDYKLTFNNSNDFVFYATYSSNGSNFEKRPHGNVFIKFDGAQKLLTENIYPFDDEFLKAFANIKDPSKNPKNNYLKNFGIKDVLFKSNGDLLVMFEEHTLSKSAIEGTPGKYNYIYRYGDFLVLDLNGESGETTWWQSFEKKQEVKSRATVDPYGSFVYFLKDDRLFVLWNNTELSMSSIPPANWTEPDGTKYIKHRAFHDKTMHGTFMHVVEPDGSMGFENTKFGLPLFNMHSSAIFEMSMTTPIFFEMNGELVVMASMHNGGKRYRFGFINL